MIVHLVTDRRRLTVVGQFERERRCLLLQAQHAIDASVDCIQIRERDLEARGLVDLAVAVVDLTRGTPTRVVINDRVDVALASGADGVHLRGDSMPPLVARRLAPPGFLIGCSVHNVREAVEAAGADYLIAGSVWSTPSKPEGHPVLGLEGLAAIVAAVNVPVLAIGGVTTDRGADVGASGAAGVAAIGLFMSTSAGDGCRAVPLGQTIAMVRRQFDTSRSRS